MLHHGSFNPFIPVIDDDRNTTMVLAYKIQNEREPWDILVLVIIMNVSESSINGNFNRTPIKYKSRKKRGSPHFRCYIACMIRHDTKPHNGKA